MGGEWSTAIRAAEGPYHRFLGLLRNSGARSGTATGRFVSTLSRLTCYLKLIGQREQQILLAVASHVGVGSNADQFIKDLGALAESHAVRALLASRALLVKIKRDLENQVRGLLKNLGLVIGRAKFNVFAVRAEELIENRPELVAAIRPLLEARVVNQTGLIVQEGVVDSDPEAIADRCQLQVTAKTETLRRSLSWHAQSILAWRGTHREGCQVTLC